jgi:hypothetical protein
MKLVQATVTVDLTIEFPVKNMREVRKAAQDWGVVKQFVQDADVGSVCLEHFEEITDKERLKHLMNKFRGGKRGNALRFGLELIGLAAARRK